MNGENEALLQQGIGEVRAGNKREGARLLAQVVKTEPQSEEAWFWLAAATDQPSEASACLRRVLAINPNNTRASQALEMLGQSAGSSRGGLNTGELLGVTPNQARGLNTGELMGYGGSGGAATIAPPPSSSSSFSNTPAPFSENELMGVTSTTTPNNPPSRPSDLFGSTGTLNDAPSVPPPPFGQPGWAASNESAPPPRPPLPNFNSDPYTGQPSPSFNGGGGVRLGQLDPELAAQQAAQAAQTAAAPSYYDAGAEIRAGLLDESVRSQPQVQINSNTSGATKVKSPKVKKIKLAPPPITTTTRRRRNRLPLFLLLLLVLIALGGLAYWKFVLNNNNAAPVANNPTDTAAVDTTAIPTTLAGTTNGGGITAGGLAVTTLAVNSTTTAAVTTTAALVTTASTTTSVATTLVATTVAPTPVPTTNVAGVTGQGQTPATTLPAITVPPLENGKPPADVLQYVSDSKALMDKLKTYEDLLTTKVEVPYRKGDIPAQAELNKLFRTDISTMEMGQYAYRLKNQFVPLGGYYLGQISSDYADDISNASKAWDGFFDSGKLSYLDDVSRYTEKAQKDRIRWVSALAKGYPYK